MSQAITLTALEKKSVGKSYNRNLRRAGKVPAIVYGKSFAPVSLQLEHKEMLKALENEQIYTSKLNLKVANKSYSVLLKDIQRHPFKKQLMHIDFLQVTDDTIVNVHVPIHFLNEESCFGVKTQGGTINHQMIEVEIKCNAGSLPDYIALDMQDRKLGDIIHLSDLTLPKGASIPTLELGADHDLPVARVTLAHVAKEEEEEVESPESVTPTEKDEEQ